MEAIQENAPLKEDSPSGSLLTDQELHETAGSTGSVTTASDDLLDNISVISDTFTINSKSLKKHDIKKISALMQKLKQENATLRNSLTKMNATDVATLKNKLRGTQADAIRLKQVNIEMKDRIQILEERVSSLLVEQSQLRADSPTDRAKLKLAEAFAEKRKKQQSDQSGEAIAKADTSVSYATEHNIIVERYQYRVRELEEEVKYWQKKHRHCEKLIKSYEVKMQLMQEEMGEREVSSASTTALSSSQQEGENSKEASMPPGVSFKPETKTSRQGKGKGNEEEEVKRRVEQARAVDQKTIQELAAEVKRLVCLLPRKAIEGGEISLDAENENEEQSSQSLSKYNQMTNGDSLQTSTADMETSQSEAAKSDGLSKIFLNVLIFIAVALPGVLIVYLAHNLPKITQQRE